MNGADGAVQAVAADYDGNRQLARSLRDRDNVNLLAGNRGEDAPRKTRRSTHAFADDGDQADIAIHFDRLQISVGEFERQVFFQIFGGSLQLGLTNQETEVLAIAGAGDGENFDIRLSQSFERSGHYLGTTENRVGGFDRNQRDVLHRGNGVRSTGGGNARNDSRTGLFGREAVLAPHWDFVFHQRRERSRMQNFGAVVGEFGGLAVSDFFEHAGVFDEPRIGGHNTVDIGPDPEFGCVQRGGGNGSGKIGAAAAQRGGPAV